MIRRTFFLSVTALALVASAAPASARDQWTKAQANGFHAKQPWLVGANYTPASAINQLEMWQAETWDPATIDKELAWAESIGMVYELFRYYFRRLARVLINFQMFN